MQFRGHCHQIVTKTVEFCDRRALAVEIRVRVAHRNRDARMPEQSRGSSESNLTIQRALGHPRLGNQSEGVIDGNIDRDSTTIVFDRKMIGIKLDLHRIVPIICRTATLFLFRYSLTSSAELSSRSTMQSASEISLGSMKMKSVFEGSPFAFGTLSALSCMNPLGSVAPRSALAF